MTRKHSANDRRRRGFEQASGLLQSQIRKVGESRGFAVSRLLTHWSDIVGKATSSVALPVNVSYAKGGFGATLTILTTGAQAPMLQADLPRIKDRVNSCYGYAAIARIKITQTAPTGFADGKVSFEHEKTDAPRTVNPKITIAAREVAKEVINQDLRAALESLGKNVLAKSIT